MMNRLDPIYEVTKEMLALLVQPVSSSTRETIIEQVNVLIDEREKRMTKVKPPYSAAENKTGIEVVAMNKEIQQKMDALFMHLKQEMKQIKKQKKSNRNYLNPYKHVQGNDGMFMDSKK